MQGFIKFKTVFTSFRSQEAKIFGRSQRNVEFDISSGEGSKYQTTNIRRSVVLKVPMQIFQRKKGEIGFK